MKIGQESEPGCERCCEDANNKKAIAASLGGRRYCPISIGAINYVPISEAYWAEECIGDGVRREDTFAFGIDCISEFDC